MDVLYWYLMEGLQIIGVASERGAKWAWTPREPIGLSLGRGWLQLALTFFFFPLEIWSDVAQAGVDFLCS